MLHSSSQISIHRACQLTILDLDRSQLGYDGADVRFIRVCDPTSPLVPVVGVEGNKGQKGKRKRGVERGGGGEEEEKEEEKGRRGGRVIRGEKGGQGQEINTHTKGEASPTCTHMDKTKQEYFFSEEGQSKAIRR